MEYRTQTILGAMQGVTILAGTLIVSVAMRVTEQSIVIDPHFGDPFEFPRRVANWGFFLLPLPVLWVLLTLRNERIAQESRSATLISGLTLLFGLAILFGWAAVKATVIFS
jgi:hypothetical protein